MIINDIHESIDKYIDEQIVGCGFNFETVSVNGLQGLQARVRTLREMKEKVKKLFDAEMYGKKEFDKEWK